MKTESFDDAARRLLAELNARKVHRAAGPEEFENSGHEGAGAGPARRFQFGPATLPVLRIIQGGKGSGSGEHGGGGTVLKPLPNNLSDVGRLQEKQAFGQDEKLGQPIPFVAPASGAIMVLAEASDAAGCPPCTGTEYESAHRLRVCGTVGVVSEDE